MKLILLDCPNCSHPLQPDNDDIVFACPNCHLAVHLGAEGPEITSIRYALRRADKGDKGVWAPFWVFDGKVKIRKRETQGRRSNTKDSLKTWEALRRFYVPAWDLNIHTAQDVGTKLTLQQPDLDYIEQPAEVKLVPATVSPADALKLLEFIVLAIEARRKDWLKELVFDIDVGEPILIGLPQAVKR